MRLSQLVLSIDENDPETLASVGWAKAYITADFGAAMEMVDRAVSLNPSSSMAWAYRGITCVFVGRTEDAIQSLEWAMRLSPLDPMLYTLQAFMAIAFINLRRFDDAVGFRPRIAPQEAKFHAGPSLPCGGAGASQYGIRKRSKQSVRLLEHEPDFRMSIWANRMRQWPTKSLAEGLHKAGLPQ